MVRISDILKKTKEIKKEKEKPPLEFAPPQQEMPSPSQKISEMRISPVVMKQTKVVSSQESMNLYEETVPLIREILKENIDYKSIGIERLTAQIEKIIDQLRLGNENLLMLVLIRDFTDTNYLFCHSVNTCIYSLEVGLGLGYERPKLIDLGVSALFYDIGMLKYLDLVDQPRKLTFGEYEKVKNHTIDGGEILKEINGINKIAIDAACQHRERIDGSGYPKSLREESINEYAKIIGLVDVYEAMTHPRSYRDRYLPVETIREILTYKNTFEYKLIKILIERIGIFPVL